MKKLKKFDTAEIGKYEDLIYFGLAVFIVLGLFCAAVWGAPRGSGSYTQCIGSPCDTLYLPVSREEPGYLTDNTTNSINLNAIRISSAINRLEILANNTNYIQLRNTLQSGATFYVSSGTAYSLNIGTPTISAVGFGFTVSTRSLIGVIRSTATGSAGDPSLQIGNDTNTGLFSSATDAIGFSAGGTERLTIGTNVGISSTAARTLLGVQGGGHFTSSITANSALFEGNATIEGHFAASGTVTLGDASGDNLTIQSSSITLINQTTFFVNNSNGLFVANSSVTLSAANARVIYNSADGLGNACSKWVPIAYASVLSTNTTAVYTSAVTTLTVTGIGSNAKMVLLDFSTLLINNSGSAVGVCFIETQRTVSDSLQIGSAVQEVADASQATRNRDTAQRMVMVDSSRQFRYQVTTSGAAFSQCTQAIDISAYCE